ncbi:hypothetical protein KEM48_004012 [Puccinia striiformis f. sp. tritici PST-130]|nr:hypothetical protein KEM48_004012 [Puccinia striiformis f. sp. tritici PST-130]
MSNSAEELVKRSQEIYSVVRVFEDMNYKYEFPPADMASGPTDPDLTIQDMATKGEILRKLQSSLLPAIKEHVTSLLKSVEELEEEYPHPDVDLTLGISSDLDQTLMTTRNHYSSAIRHSCNLAPVAMMVTDPAWAWNQASKSRQDIHVLTAHVIDSIDDTIAWSLGSDWAIHANPSLELTPDLARLTISSTEDADPSDHTYVETPRKAAMERTSEVANSTIRS